MLSGLPGADNEYEDGQDDEEQGGGGGRPLEAVLRGAARQDPGLHLYRVKGDK